jgi:hypothetical protein
MRDGPAGVWVENFVAKGGDRATGYALYQRTYGQGTKVKTPKSTLPVTVELFEEQSPIALPPMTKTVIPQKKRRGRPKRTGVAHSQVELDLFQLGLEIEEKPAQETNSLGFIASELIYASLPHSNVAGGVYRREIQTKEGPVKFTCLTDPEIGLPYGKIPRLILFYLCTEATIKKEPVIYLGRSRNEFARKLGMTGSGGEKGDLTRICNQATRLFASRITLSSDSMGFRWRHLDISEQGILLFDRHPASQWESRLTLSGQFFESCLHHSVPVDLRIIHKLQSPFAIDIYVWLTYRYNKIKDSLYIGWQALKDQIGANFADNPKGLLNFIAHFKRHLKSVSAFYPQARFEVGTTGLTLLPSPSHILPAWPTSKIIQR